ncbi:Chromosome_partition protein [Hexamita inflata]|uniref:Chromosome partition protein n=1 Tax=Hexamita inflata TaxID=28002 RepID=A0AA86NU33_9EUKA|nr:Chromosome partition protein [Hexamita inflata]
MMIIINTSLTSNINSIKTDIGNINNGLNNLYAYDQHLQGQVNNHNGDISNLYNSVNNLNGYDQYLNGQIVSLKAQIDALVAGNIQVSNVLNNCSEMLTQVCGNGICSVFRSISLVGQTCDGSGSSSGDD